MNKQCQPCLSWTLVESSALILSFSFVGVSYVQWYICMYALQHFVVRYSCNVHCIFEFMKVINEADSVPPSIAIWVRLNRVRIAVVGLGHEFIIVLLVV